MRINKEQNTFCLAFIAQKRLCIAIYGYLRCCFSFN